MDILGHNQTKAAYVVIYLETWKTDIYFSFSYHSIEYIQKYLGEYAPNFTLLL